MYSRDPRPEVGLEKTYEYTAAITWECEVSLCVHGRERSISRFSTRVSTHIRHLRPVGVCDTLAQISRLATYTLSRRCTHTSFVSQLQALDHSNTSRDGRDRSISRFSTRVSTHIRHLRPVGVCDALAQISRLATYTLSRRCTNTLQLLQVRPSDRPYLSRNGRLVPTSSLRAPPAQRERRRRVECRCGGQVYGRFAAEDASL